MSYVILFILGVVILFIYLWKSAQKEIDEEDKQPSDFVDEDEVLSILNEVNSLDDFKKLHAKFNRYESSITGHSGQAKMVKYETLSKAYYQACDKTVMYQFDPILNLDSPRIEIDNFRKLFPIDEYHKVKKEFGQNRDFIELSFSDYYINKDYEKIPPYLDKLIAYKDVMENEDLTLENKASKVKELCKNRAFKEEFFSNLSLNEIYDEILISELNSLKVPLPKKLYEAGIKSKKDLQNCDIKEIKKIPGFGPKKVELLMQIIETTHNSK